ncbi:unnamed protein product [Nezara viridula]|uniref:Endonuclease n=1 Tax=Nezara viridula TaxID=85310 RepID=A0A9P0HNV6_NEZVI|nr:unnamed protein product [Nezara viridula]
MNNFLFKSKNLIVVATVGITSWYAGSYFERNKAQINQCYCVRGNASNKIKHLPGLPVFATVSAATVIQPPHDSENRLVPIGDPTSPMLTESSKYGFMGLDTIRTFDDFVLSYDRRNKVPNWVFEHLTADRFNADGKVDRSKCEFTEDELIHKYFRSTNKDYKGSGFDRGHLAAAGNHRLTQRHCDQTFYLSNIAPQVGDGFNRHAWNRLEKYIRKLTRFYPHIYVCTGPLYLPRVEADKKKYIKYQVIGPKEVAVPTHFFKVVVMETTKGEYHLEAYVMPNQAIDNEIPLTSFRVPPETIEIHSGLLFLDKLQKQRLVKVNGIKQ